MLKLVEVANYLTNQLNTIGSIHTPAYSFNIQAEVGANKNSKDVQGILKTTKTELPPTTAGKNVVYNLSVELSIVAPTSNFNLKNVEEIVNSFVNSANGQEIQFESGKGLITLSLCQAGQFKTEVGQGNVVPLTFNVGINYTEKIATSKSKHWFLQTNTDTQGNPVYTEIPYLTENVLLTKEGRTNKINTKKYDETFMIGQQKRYMFTLIYDEENAICTMLQKDILDGRPNTKYKLKYYDGKTYTSTNPYITTVSLYETANTESEKPNVAKFKVTFADVDDGESSIKYYIALVDNPFDEATENTRCFSDTIVDGAVTATAEENQHAWYNALVAEGADWDEIPAPNISSVYLTNQIYKNSRNYNLFNIVNKNYAIIRMVRTGIISHEDPMTHQVTTETGVIEEKWLYYWTKNPSALAEGQVSFDLSMDTLQTYLFNPEIEFEGNMIQRASLNRWVDNGDGTVSFDGTVTSNLFERENIKDIAKRLVSRQKMTFDYGNADLTQFFNNNVIAWCYVLLKRTGSGTGGNLGQYPIYDSSGSPSWHAMENTKARMIETRAADDVHTAIDYNAHCTLVFPIMRRRANIRIYYGNDTIAYMDEDISNINKLFGGSETSASPYIISVKLSCKPPFKPGEIPSNYSITGTDIKTLNLPGTLRSNGIIAIDNNNLPGDYALLWSTYYQSMFGRHAAIYYLYDWMQGTQLTGSTNATYTFNKTAIIGQAKNSSFNPKLNNMDYKNCTINVFGTTQDFDMQKLNTNTPTFLYSEAMTLDVAKYKVIPTTTAANNIYSGTNQNISYNGLVGTNDTSIEISTDEYDNYIANNKNFYLSFQNQQKQAWRDYTFSSANNILNGVMSGNWLGVMSGLTGSGTQAGQLLTRQNYDIQQRDLSMDNMRAAPDIVSNANGNAMFNTTSGEIVPYIEIYEALPHELEMANDDMYMNGFTYNKVDDLLKFINKTGSKHIRKYFNYVKALIGNISGVSISSEARTALRERLANGVRFWHVNTIDYEHENYEKWLNAVSQYTTFTTTAQYVGYIVYVTNSGYTVVTVDNKDDLGIVPGTTIAYYNIP